MAEANLITQFWTQPTNYFPFVLSTVMALSGKSSVLLLRGQLWWRLKTIVLWQAAISTLSSGSQQGQEHGSRFKCPPATSALWSTHPVLALLGNSLLRSPRCRAPAGRVSDTSPDDVGICWVPPGWERKGCLSGRILPGNSLRHMGAPSTLAD